mgnify:CR=1 FL=1
MSAKNSAWLGMKGAATSCMPTSSGRLLDLNWLQRLQAATTFSQSSLPPRDIGRIWSLVSMVSSWLCPQYMHLCLSLANNAELLNLGLFLGLARRDPPQAIIADKANFDCFPLSLHHPPLTSRTTAPNVQTTSSLAWRQTASCHVTHSIGKPAVFRRSILAFVLAEEWPTIQELIVSQSSLSNVTCYVKKWPIAQINIKVEYIIQIIALRLTTKP